MRVLGVHHDGNERWVQVGLTKTPVSHAVLRLSSRASFLWVQTALAAPLPEATRPHPRVIDLRDCFE